MARRRDGVGMNWESGRLLCSEFPGGFQSRTPATCDDSLRIGSLETGRQFLNRVSQVRSLPGAPPAGTSLPGFSWRGRILAWIGPSRRGRPRGATNRLDAAGPRMAHLGWATARRLRRSVLALEGGRE